VEILSDPQRAREMGKRGREQAIQKFSPERIVGEYETLYAELIGNRREPAGKGRT
jgi:glycosyltransferase involved in cell wall biosynthesis